MNIIKSFILPGHMKRYRYMSVFIAIGIFVLSVYILRIPFQFTSKNSKEELIASDVLSVKAFAELEDEGFDFNIIKNSQYFTEAGKLNCNYEDDNNYRLYNLQYEKEGQVRRVHIVFDPYNNLEKALEALKEEFIDLYNLSTPLEQNNLRRASQIANLTYIQLQKDPLLIKADYFESLRVLSDQALDEEAAKISNFSYFNIETQFEIPEFLLLFTEKFVEYQIPLFDKDGTELPRAETLATIDYSEKMKIDFRSIDSISDLGKQFASNVMDLYLQYILVQYTLQTILITVFYPLLIVFILWLFFRKNGNLKTFKEYYNIAAISSIIPLIIAFIVLWFFPTMTTLYGLVLSVFYVFNLYRINLKAVEV